MKRLLCLLLMVASTSCEKERLPQNFLEKYHNSFWLADDGGDQNIGFYDDPLHFVYTAYCTRAGFGDFTIEQATDFLITKNTLDEFHFSILFIEECNPPIYLNWKVKAFEDNILSLTRKRLIGYRACEPYKDGGDFTTYFRRQEKTLEEVCSESQPLF